MKKYLLYLLLLLPGMNAHAQYTSASFYVAAHPDDWQLFMGINAFTDITSGTTGYGSKVIFIYMTAGEPSGGASHYADMRQVGADRSIQFCSDAFDAHSTWSYVNMPIFAYGGGALHHIARGQYKNVVSYYLRLPDGNFEGNPNTLTKFAMTYHAASYDNWRSTSSCDEFVSTPVSISPVTALTNVDGLATYSSYDDLKNTIAAIIDFESASIPEIWMNAPETDCSLNKGDHPDHISTSFLAQDAVNTLKRCCNVALFVDYHCNDLLANLSPEEIAMEAGLLGQISFGLSHNGEGAEWDPHQPPPGGHVKYTGSNRFRIIRTCSEHRLAERENLKKFMEQDPSVINRLQPVDVKEEHVEANAEDDLIKVFPNPTSSMLHISYTVPEQGNIEIAVFDLVGKQMNLVVNEQQTMGQYTLSYNTEKLAPGNYVVMIKTTEYTKSISFTKSN